MTDVVRVIRVIEYVGPRDWVEKTVARSIHGTMEIGEGITIKAATIGDFAEIINEKDEGAKS